MKYLLLVPVLLFVACKTGPKITVCVSTPSINGFECFNEQNQQFSTLPYINSDKYVAMSPSDAQSLLNYCGVPSKEAQDLTKLDVLKYAQKIQAAVE